MSGRDAIAAPMPINRQDNESLRSATDIRRIAEHNRAVRASRMASAVVRQRKRRGVLLHGWLWKRADVLHQWRRRYFVCCRQVVGYYRTKQEFDRGIGALIARAKEEFEKEQGSSSDPLASESKTNKIAGGALRIPNRTSGAGAGFDQSCVLPLPLQHLPPMHFSDAPEGLTVRSIPFRTYNRMQCFELRVGAKKMILSACSDSGQQHTGTASVSSSKDSPRRRPPNTWPGPMWKSALYRLSGRSEHLQQYDLVAYVKCVTLVREDNFLAKKLLKGLASSENLRRTYGLYNSQQRKLLRDEILLRRKPEEDSPSNPFSSTNSTHAPDDESTAVPDDTHSDKEEQPGTASSKEDKAGGDELVRGDVSTDVSSSETEPTDTDKPASTPKDSNVLSDASNDNSAAASGGASPANSAREPSTAVQKGNLERTGPSTECKEEPAPPAAPKMEQSNIFSADKIARVYGEGKFNRQAFLASIRDHKFKKQAAIVSRRKARGSVKNRTLSHSSSIGGAESMDTAAPFLNERVLRVPKAEEGKGKVFALFEISVRTGSLQWSVWRRFSQFQIFRENLVRSYSTAVHLPDFKGLRRWWPLSKRLEKLVMTVDARMDGSSVSQLRPFAKPLLLLAKREMAFSNFVKEVLRHPTLAACPETMEFLGLLQNIRSVERVADRRVRVAKPGDVVVSRRRRGAAPKTSTDTRPPYSSVAVNRGSAGDRLYSEVGTGSVVEPGSANGRAASELLPSPSQRAVSPMLSSGSPESLALGPSGGRPEARPAPPTLRKMASTPLSGSKASHYGGGRPGEHTSSLAPRKANHKAIIKYQLGIQLSGSKASRRKYGMSLTHRRHMSLRAAMDVLDVGDIVLTHTPTRLAAVTRTLTKSPWDHVAIVVRYPCVSRNPSKSRVNLCLFEAVSGGIKCEPLHSALERMLECNQQLCIRKLVWPQETEEVDRLSPLPRDDLKHRQRSPDSETGRPSSHRGGETADTGGCAPAGVSMEGGILLLKPVTLRGRPRKEPVKLRLQCLQRLLDLMIGKQYSLKGLFHKKTHWLAREFLPGYTCFRSSAEADMPQRSRRNAVDGDKRRMDSLAASTVTGEVHGQSVYKNGLLPPLYMLGDDMDSYRFYCSELVVLTLYVLGVVPESAVDQNVYPSHFASTHPQGISPIAGYLTKEIFVMPDQSLSLPVANASLSPPSANYQGSGAHSSSEGGEDGEPWEETEGASSPRTAEQKHSPGGGQKLNEGQDSAVHGTVEGATVDDRATQLEEAAEAPPPSSSDEETASSSDSGTSD